MISNKKKKEILTRFDALEDKYNEIINKQHQIIAKLNLLIKVSPYKEFISRV